MKAFITSLALLSSISCFATSVKITSFSSVRIGDEMNNPLAELCGKVQDPTAEVTYLKVTVDKGSRNPGTYNTIAGKDGRFCLTLITHRGNAEVTIFGEKATSLVTLTK